MYATMYNNPVARKIASVQAHSDDVAKVVSQISYLVLFDTNLTIEESQYANIQDETCRENETIRKER